MEAAEKLVARKGLENVSIKEIVKEAGQKNESALQYHFKSFQGLINAIVDKRSLETQMLRAELLEELYASQEQTTLRDACRMMVMPSFLLARRSAGYRRYILSFSQNLALRNNTLAFVNRHGAGGESGRETSELLRQHLPHLDTRIFQARLEAAIRLVSISMGHHAREKNAFRGEQSDWFISNLLDAMVGLLNAPVSAETKALTKK
jgi:AcrR family transcriptional regulator